MRVNKIFQFMSRQTPSALPSSLEVLFSVLTYGSIVGNEAIGVRNGYNFAITGKDFSDTDKIPGTSACTLSLPNTAALKTDDFFDTAFYTPAGSVRQVPISYLQNNDYSRLLVKYSDEAPYDIEWIGLLDDAANPTNDQWDQLHYYFRLHPLWSGAWNDNGFVKENRSLGMVNNAYKDWAAQCTLLGLTLPETTVKAGINRMALGFRNIDVADGMDRFWNSMLNDSSLVSGCGTVSLFNPASTRLTFPVAPTYTVRGFEGNASGYADTGFRPDTQGVNYQLNSASRIGYQYKISSGFVFIDGTASGGTNNFFNGNTAQTINGNNSGPTITWNQLGYMAINRSASNAVELYKLQVKSTGTGTSTALPNQNQLILKGNSGLGNAGFSIYAMGKSFTETQHNGMATLMDEYKTLLGL